MISNCTDSECVTSAVVLYIAMWLIGSQVCWVKGQKLDGRKTLIGFWGDVGDFFWGGRRTGWILPEGCLHVWRAAW